MGKRLQADKYHIYQDHEIASLLEEMGITHVVWVPDSTLGLWETALADSPAIDLISVCHRDQRLSRFPPKGHTT